MSSLTRIVKLLVSFFTGPLGLPRLEKGNDRPNFISSGYSPVSEVWFNIIAICWCIISGPYFISSIWTSSQPGFLFLSRINMCATILGSIVSHKWVIVSLSQSVPAAGWGSPLHAWVAVVNRISCACCPNTGYCYEAGDMHYHILLWQYSQIYSPFATLWLKILIVEATSICMCQSFEREYRMIVALQRRELNMF